MTGSHLLYDGHFLQHLGHHYDSNIDSFIPALDPVVSKKGASKKKPTRKPPTKSAAWWKAQCALRGIDPAGTIPQLQQRLRADTNAPMLPELKEKEAKLKDKQKAKEREGKPWDVTGSYDIKCPAIQDEYDDTGELTLDIMSDDTAKGRQLFASFNFGILTGFFRLKAKKPKGEPAKKSPAHLPRLETKGNVKRETTKTKMITRKGKNIIAMSMKVDAAPHQKILPWIGRRSFR
jgi:hypothetical protein